MSAIKAIYAGIRQLGITEEDDRRDMFERITGKRRLRAMSPSDKDAVVTELRRMGFKSAGKRRQLAGPFAKKLQALWISGWNLGLVKNRDDNALLAFIKRQTGIDNTRFLQNADDADKAIEALKAWIAREGGVNWSNMDMPKWKRVPGAKVAWAQAVKLVGNANGLSTDHFQNAVFAEIPHRSSLHNLTAREWQLVMNEFGERIRAVNKQGNDHA